jgi:hypothetical protein
VQVFPFLKPSRSINLVSRIVSTIRIRVEDRVFISAGSGNEGVGLFIFDIFSSSLHSYNFNFSLEVCLFGCTVAFTQACLPHK